jgi:NADH-quinone oxidoreductase subunit J
LDALFIPLLLTCLVALASALAIVLVRRPVYAAVSLLIHSLSLAVLYSLLSASLVAVGQLVIYSGAIVVLFLFVVTLLPSGGREVRPQASRVVAALVFAAILVGAFATAYTAVLPTPAANPQESVADVGNALFGPLLVALELTSPLLLAAIVAAVAIWRRHEPRSVTATRAPTTAERHVVLHR